ncbi:MAG: hypothetical protein MMC33_006962 [Icmadophila ericetorum]|nr:hypothetical protein [Icmadophila ericetorum]
MNDGFAALRAFASTTPEYYGPQGTISLAETSLLTPTSPESFLQPREEEKKTTKKRKSWGQELPTPKTNLPPRKRAKTEDEKEQRRIERVLRNRQAAQSSRERKRQEVEKLEGEKYTIERQNYMLKQRLMQVEHDKYQLVQQVAKMSAMLAKTQGVSKDLSPPLSPQFSSDLLQHDKAIKQELEDYPFSLPSPQNTLDPRSTFSSQSPSSSRSTSPIDMDFTGASSSSDLTQHPAAMFFDRLFSNLGPSQPALHFFEDGLAPENGDDDANTFSFDSMVDLDAGQSTPELDSANSLLGFDQHAQDHFDLFSSSPALARPLKDATGRDSQMKTSYALGGSSKATSVDEKTGSEVIEGGADHGTVAILKDCETQSVQDQVQHQRFLLTLMMAIRIIEKQQKSKQRSKSKSKEKSRRKESRSRSRVSRPA